MEAFYEVPIDVIESPSQIADWAETSIRVA